MKNQTTTESHRHFFNVHQLPLHASRHIGNGRWEQFSTDAYFGVVAPALEQPFLTIRPYVDGSDKENPTQLITHKTAESIALLVAKKLAESRIAHIPTYDAPRTPGASFFRVFGYDSNLAEWFHTWYKQVNTSNYQELYSQEFIKQSTISNDSVFAKSYRELWIHFNQYYSKHYSNIKFEQQASLLQATNSATNNLPLDGITFMLAVSNGHDADATCSLDLLITLNESKHTHLKEILRTMREYDWMHIEEKNRTQKLYCYVLSSHSLNKKEQSELCKHGVQGVAEDIYKQMDNDLAAFCMYYHILSGFASDVETLIALNLDMHNQNRSITKIKVNKKHADSVRHRIEKFELAFSKNYFPTLASLVDYLIFDTPFDIEKFQGDTLFNLTELQQSLATRRAYDSILNTLPAPILDEDTMEEYITEQRDLFYMTMKALQR